MPSKPTTLSLAAMLALMTVSGPLLAAADLMTLFTTPQERQLINANRYKTEEARPAPSPVEVDESPVQQLLQEQVSVEYRISGISVSADGAHTAWINGQSYLDGEQLEDGSRVKVITGAEIRVRITTPDGKHHYATSGETLNASYMAAVEN
jgi:hypothetical protein